jgi:hypothetical protein
MTLSSQLFESYVPVYDAVPEEWDDARPFLVETLKKISNAINVREIGFFLDEELISGKQFIPGANTSGTSEQFRTILRKVINCSPLVIGVNTFAHGIVVDANFTLMQLYAGATNSLALIGEPIPNGADTISYDATNIIITVAAAYDRSWTVIEYIQEI